MKKLILITTIVLAVATTSQAGSHHGTAGLAIGAGSGAILGGTIGDTPESVILGTAIGGAVGYLVGHEMRRERRPVVRHAPPPAYRPPHFRPGPPVFRPPHHRHYRPYYRPHHIKPRPPHYNYYREPAREIIRFSPIGVKPNIAYGQCRKAEMLGTINGKARKIHGTVCRTPYGWELVR